MIEPGRSPQGYSHTFEPAPQDAGSRLVMVDDGHLVHLAGRAGAEKVPHEILDAPRKRRKKLADVEHPHGGIVAETG